MEERIIEFYYRSLSGSLNNFDFEDFFDDAQPIIESKLTEHGLTSYDDFIDNNESIYGNLEAEMPDCFTMVSDYMCFDKSRAVEAVMMAMYEAAKDNFESMFSDIIDLNNRVDAASNSDSTKSLTLLFDEVIHAQHQTGMIFEDIDTEELKKTAQEFYDADQENGTQSWV